MAVQIQLDRPHAHFTNLDFITGRVILSIVNNETISAIVVKLEGESKTRVAVTQLPPQEQLLQAMGPRGRHHAESEVHKLLYKFVTVFPNEQLQKTAPENAIYTLPAGPHEYPFKFKVGSSVSSLPKAADLEGKIPFNNDCAKNALYANSNVAGLLGEITGAIAGASYKHLKTTLPPSLDGIYGQAEIRYFVKVTVQRPAFYKENFRARTPFSFLPIEPPRPPENRRESYARRQHQFAPRIDVPSKLGLFRKASTPVPNPAVVPPNIQLDSRLPDPAIITCNEPLPLRILVTKLNDTPATIYVQLLNIELISHTNIRAHQFQKIDTTSWVMLSTSNMRMPLVGLWREAEIDAKLWNQIPIPNTVAPSFQTCNLTRHYSLDIKVGLSYGSSDNINPELTVQMLRMPVKVYSGIAPPPELLARMSDRWPTQMQPQPSSPRPQSFSQNPLTGPAPPFQASPQQPPHPGQFGVPPHGSPEEAPPSYEDAIADDFGPVDGPRRDYHQHTPSPGVGGKASGELGSDERLFPDSGRS